MSFSIDYAIVILYFVVILLVGYFRGRKEHLSDYTVNNRSTSTIMLVCSNLSTAFGIGSILGVASEAYRTGISYGLSVLFVVVFGFLALIWLAPKIKLFGDKAKAQSIADFFQKKYSLQAGTIASILTITSFLLSTSVQFIGIASLASVLTGISWELAIVLAALITVSYTAFGGLKNDIATDFVQFWVIIVVFFSMVPLGLIKISSSTLTQLPTTHFDFFNYGGAVFFFGSLFLGVLGNLSQMDIWQRIYSAKSVVTVRKSFSISFFVSIPLYILPIVFGLWARQLFPGINAEQGLFSLMKEILPAGLLGLGFSGILAAAMSSVDSAIVVGSTSITNDIYAKYFNKKAKEHHLLNRARLFAVLFSVLALVIAYFVPNIVKLGILAMFTSMNMLPSIIGGFFWKKANSKAALWSLIFGTIVLYTAWFTIGVNAWLPGLLTSTIVFVVGSLVKK